jgi:peptidoglycan L-alanyl-D-glutamate endopeptidase CwlK
MDNISETRLQLICPFVADKVRQLVSMLDFDVRVVQGLRSWNDQADLWAKGRALDAGGIWVIVNPKAIVTKCVPGNSWHNFGLAVDLCPDDPTIPGYQADWNAAHPTWKRMEDAGLATGFVCGCDFRSFPDQPHFQMTFQYPVNPNDEVRYLLKEAGVQAVWDSLQM